MWKCYRALPGQKENAVVSYVRTNDLGHPGLRQDRGKAMEPYFPPTKGGQWSTGIELRNHGVVSLIEDRPLDSHLDANEIAREILRTIGIAVAQEELNHYFPRWRWVCPEKGVIIERRPTLELLELIARHRSVAREIGV